MHCDLSGLIPESFTIASLIFKVRFEFEHSGSSMILSPFRKIIIEKP